MAHGWGRLRWRVDGGERRPYLDFRPLGRVYSSPSGAPFRTRASAERVLREMRDALRHGSLSPEAIVARFANATNPRLTVGSKYRAWLDWQGDRAEAGEISYEHLRELERYGQAATATRSAGYLVPLFERRIDAVRAGDLADLDLALARRGLSAKTRSHALAALHAFYGWLVEREDVDRLPRFPRVRIVRELRATLTSEQQRAVLDAIPERSRGIFLALSFHGIRPGEACRLDVADYDFAAGLISIRAKKSKTKEAAIVPASDELRAWIAAHVERAGRLDRLPLFRNPLGRSRGQRWTADTLGNVWRAAERRADVPHVGLYAGTKHTSATEARRRGASLEDLRAALRHADVRSTELYAQAAKLAPVSLLSVPAVSLADRRRENGKGKG